MTTPLFDVIKRYAVSTHAIVLDSHSLMSLGYNPEGFWVKLTDIERVLAEQNMALIIGFQNDGTGPDDSANYKITVYINERPIAHSTVKGHPRDEGWLALVKRFVESDIKDIDVSTQMMLMEHRR